MVLLSPFHSSVVLPLLHQGVQKVNQFNFSLSSRVTFQDSVFTFEEISISVLQDKDCGYQKNPYPPLNCAGGRNSFIMPCGCTLQWRPLSKCWLRLESTQGAAHPFAEVAVHFWKQYSHVCSLLHLSWWTCLCNTSWKLVHAEGRTFSCYLDTVKKRFLLLLLKMLQSVTTLHSEYQQHIFSLPSLSQQENVVNLNSTPCLTEPWPDSINPSTFGGT